MSKMISVASGFQYSVNIGYDLNSDEKLKNFIPTKAALSLLEDVLQSTNSSSTDRARVLIGAYGKGKSHIVLTILSMLEKKDRVLFEKLMPKISENPRLQQLVDNYYEGENKIMPIIISGINTSLTQAFFLSLQRTLSDNGMLDIMPETNYKAAVAVIERWKKEFPETYKKFESEIDMPAKAFADKLSNFDVEAYEKFEEVYPVLTSGSTFNPFLGFDVIELYENAANGLKKKGYTGIYVVYDEFSKYLEANITDASVSDTKMLQDFAEKCNRSGKLQMHLMLISHKEISNYIDKLPQQKVDGWKGVSERFKHIHMNNDFSQTYEIISTVIRKDAKAWPHFCKKYGSDFSEIEKRYSKHLIFSGASEELTMAVYGCYPLHPVSTFILPRLSERVAQNERTLFTFLSADGSSTLPAFLKAYSDDKFSMITPDAIYDYFEPLFKKETYGSEIHNNYLLTSAILTQIPEDSLGSKIIKTISLTYILEQFERLKPTKEELVGIYSTEYDVASIEKTITELIDKEFVIYLKRSNGFLRLKKTSGVDIKQKIQDLVELQGGRCSVKDTLNESNFDNYMYPARYNDEHEMTRFFSFEFIEGKEITEDVDWDIKSEKIKADGIIYGIIPESNEDIKRVTDIIEKTSKGKHRYIFIVPRQYSEIEPIVLEYNAITVLKEKAVDDEVLFDEYEVVLEDVNEIIKNFMSGYTHPEEFKSKYFYNGSQQRIRRKATLTELMSVICDEEFGLTPIINNEAVNRDEITTVSNNSRSKIVAALLRNELEPNLGLSGSGQEVSIMRSTLIRTGIWDESTGLPIINLSPDDANIRNMLATIENFILEAQQTGRVNFGDLYKKLTLPEFHIGLRKGLIPIYLAAVLHQYKQHALIADRFGQVLISADTLALINFDPASYELMYLDWSPEKEEYIQRLAEIFSVHVIEAERSSNSYDYVANAMYRWFMGLPKYSKECQKTSDGKKIQKRYVAVVRTLKQNTNGFELIFKKFPEIFNYEEITVDIAEEIAKVKACYDNLLNGLRETLITDVKMTFVSGKKTTLAKQMSLSSVVHEWCDSLDEKVFEQLFKDGTDRCLSLFKTITNDEMSFISRFAKLVTDLRLEDWDDDTQQQFLSRIETYKKTAEEFQSKKKKSDDINTSNYQLMYADNEGQTITKRFDRVEISKRGKLLYNQISSSLDSMGQSISEQEKRQILMEILKKLC